MGQKFFEDSIGSVSYSSGAITLGNSRLTVGGQQYQTSSLQHSISSLTASTRYNLFAVISTTNGQVILTSSVNSFTVGPAGYKGFKFIRSFYTNASGAFAAFTGAVSDPNPVGAVIHSMLTEPQFQALNGTSWILADGRSVAGSQYSSVTGVNNVPDLRGVVLRGKNNGSTRNPDGDLALGTFQDQATAKNGLYDAGHSHTLVNTPTISFYGGSNGNGYNPGAAYNGPNATPTIAAANANIQSTNNETRMRNVTVNIFIKINTD